MATTYDVTVATDPGTFFDGTTGGPGTLSYAIAQLNASNPADGPYTINVTTDVNLSGNLSPILGSVTINGNGHTITATGGTTAAGGLPNRIFFVGTDTASQQAHPNSIIGQRQQVTLQNLNLNNGTAQGGSATDGGGGGLGAGGALFVNQTADVTLANVNFAGNRAIGGSATAGTHTGGGGGGLGGAGGQGDPDGGGGGLFAGGGNGSGALGLQSTVGGGGAGVFGFGGTIAGGGGFSGYLGMPAKLQLYGISGSGGTGTTTAGTKYQGGANGGYGGFNAGGGFGGGNANPNYGNGGNGGFGGGGGQSTSGPGGSRYRVGNGGNGGFGGGGGASTTIISTGGTRGGNGGFGGGGGGGVQFAQGGDGGFGGGGGGSGGIGGFGGGGGGGGGGGFGGGTFDGGGAGLGGAVFVVSGGTLTIAGDETLDGTAAAGTSASGIPGTQPSAFGGGIFYQGTDGATSTLSVGAGNQTFSSSIADYIGSGGTNPGGGATANNQGGSVAIFKSGSGTLTLSSANTYSGGTGIGGGTVDLGQMTSAGSGAIMFGTMGGQATGTLVLESNAQVLNGTFGNTLTNFAAGATLDLKGFSGVTAFPVTGNTLTLFGTATINGAQGPLPQPASESFDLSGNSALAYTTTSDGHGGTFVTGLGVCFAAGTRIRTANGDVAVEQLAVGDRALTSSGAYRPIRWLGHRIIDCRTHPRPQEITPVRISAHAFGEGRPSRDLFLSPGHPVLVGADDDGVGGHLVPIMCLINGTTIERVSVAQVTYWHVELDQHDILLAEGLPAESYIDLGSRPWFSGADSALYDPDFALPGMPGRCRPVVADGPIVEAERRRLDMVFATRLTGACAWPDAEASLSLG